MREMSAPTLASSRAMGAPIPREPPVTTACRPASGRMLPSAGLLEAVRGADVAMTLPCGIGRRNPASKLV